MTKTIEQEALKTAVEASGRRMQDYNVMAEENILRRSIEAHARALEAHAKFRQEVSDAVEQRFNCNRPVYGVLGRFIIAKPDPVVEAIRDMALTDATQEDADRLRAALAARGLKLVEVGDAD